MKKRNGTKWLTHRHRDTETAVDGDTTTEQTTNNIAVTVTLTDIIIYTGIDVLTAPE